MIDLAPSLRAALIADATIAAALPAHLAAESVFTRRPVPSGVTYPFIVISPDVALTDDDMVAQQQPTVFRDVAVYGQNDTPARYRAVESIAYRVRDLFHRQRDAIAPSGWTVIDIQASGPFPAPTDDDSLVARVVSLTVRLTPAS